MQPSSNRIHKQSRVLLAIVLTFALILVVLLAMFITGAVKSARNPEEPTDPNQEQPGDPDDNKDPTDPENPVSPVFTVEMEAAQINEGMLIQVNATHAYQFPATNTHLVNIYNSLSASKTLGKNYKLRTSALQMDKDAFRALDRMLTDFATVSGHSDVQIYDAYRSKEQQDAKGTATKGGYSEHHTGLCVALNVLNAQDKTLALSSSEDYNWLYENCYKYGFVVRYPATKAAITGVSDYEECFRYVGYIHAYIMKQNDMCLEEYLTYLRGYPAGETTALSVTGDDDNTYRIYYVPATGGKIQVPAPENDPYTISGDNESGFIVTVTLS